MAFDLRAAVLTTSLSGALARAPREVTEEFGKGFRTIGSRFVRTMTRERLRKSGTPTYGDSRPGVFLRSGSLASGLLRKVEGQGSINRLTLRVGWFDPKLARIASTQEFGGTIRPTRSKYLTIPLPAAMTPSGVLRRPARQWQNTFFFRSKAGNLILARSLGKGALEPLFVLKREVTLKPRLGFQDLWDSERFRSERFDILRESIDRGLSRAGF